MAFVERVISLTFTKVGGTFAETGVSTFTVEGLRVQCNVFNVGGISVGAANLRVLGLTREQLNDLSGLNSGFMVQRMIQLDIRAGDAGSPLQLIFSGQMNVGQIDMSGQPDSALVIVAAAGMIASMTPANPTSYPASASHLDVLADLAKRAGLAFEPNGPPKTLATMYVFGSYRDQMLRVADAANVNIAIIDNTLVVWPRRGFRGTNSVPIISPESGLVGYPSYSDNGIGITTLFNPFLRLGQLFDVKSSLPFACGRWIAFGVKHDLESQTPNGKWFTTCTGQPYLGQPNV